MGVVIDIGIGVGIVIVIGAFGINSGGNSVYIKFPASVMVVPGIDTEEGFPKANVIFSCLGVYAVVGV